MTPDHKALCDRLRGQDPIPSRSEVADAVDAIVAAAEATIADLEAVILDVDRRLHGRGNGKWIPLHIEEAVQDIAARENARRYAK